MPLLNYTTKVSVSKTSGEVQKLLVRAGARQISMTFDDDGEPDGIAFTVETEYGPRSFALPVHAERVLAVLERQRVDARFRSLEHARSVAWRIVKDWLEAQLAIIESESVKLDQVMLPYMKTGPAGETVYELYRSQQLALGTGS